MSETISTFQTRTVPSVTTSIRKTNWKDTAIKAAVSTILLAVAIVSRSDASFFLAAVGYYMWSERAKAQKEAPEN